MVSLSVPQNTPWALDAERHDSNRHRKGDTYLIGGKPYDPLDPGPWPWKDDPDFQPDRRTGRHRRGELPDPIAETPSGPLTETLPDPFSETRRPRPYPDPATTFGKLREDAWTRFLEESAVLAEAHVAQSKPTLRTRLRTRLGRAIRRITRTARPSWA
jgi:hypothetical protein